MATKHVTYKPMYRVTCNQTEEIQKTDVVLDIEIYDFNVVATDIKEAVDIAYNNIPEENRSFYEVTHVFKYGERRMGNCANEDEED